jgi:hypothetical protein
MYSRTICMIGGMIIEKQERENVIFEEGWGLTSFTKHIILIFSCFD